MPSAQLNSLARFGITLSVSQIAKATALQERDGPAFRADPRALDMASLLSRRVGSPPPTPAAFARLAIYGHAMTQALREGTDEAWDGALRMLGEAALDHPNPVAMVAFSLRALAEHVDFDDIPARSASGLLELIEGHRALASEPSRWRLPSVQGDLERTAELVEVWEQFAARAAEARPAPRRRGPSGR